MHEVVLCADEETMRDPSLIGLQGESLESQQWLRPICSAHEARDYFRAGGKADEVWVASSNEVDPINLAAALKHDRADQTICLVAWRESGSLKSRAAAAGIDEVLGYHEMAARYAKLKQQQRALGSRRRTPARAIAGQERPSDGARLPSSYSRETPEASLPASAPPAMPAKMTPIQAAAPIQAAVPTPPAPMSAPGTLASAAPVQAYPQAPPAAPATAMQSALPNALSQAAPTYPASPGIGSTPDPFAPSPAFPPPGPPAQPEPVTAPSSAHTQPPSRPTYAAPPAPAGKRGFALTVVSASGGTGKSTVAVLSALIAAGHGYRTVLIDADLQFGDTAMMMGELGELPIDRVIAEPYRLDTANAPAGRPVLVSAPDLMERYELYLPQVPGLIERARETYDVVIVNTGSFWTESHIQLMECSSNTLFLMDQRPTSVQAARRALELCTRCGVAAHPFLFAVNRCTRNSLLSGIDISCALNGVAVAELKDGGKAVVELTGSGLAPQLIEERNDLCVSLDSFLGQVIPNAVGERSDMGGNPPKTRRKRSRFRRKGKAACL